MAPVWRRGQGCHECKVNGAAAKKELCHSFLIASKTCLAQLLFHQNFTGELKRKKMLKCQNHLKIGSKCEFLDHFINPKSEWGRAAYLSSDSKTSEDETKNPGSRLIQAKQLPFRGAKIATCKDGTRQWAHYFISLVTLAMAFGVLGFTIHPGMPLAAVQCGTMMNVDNF